MNQRKNLGIYERVNSALIVAGPQQDVDRFERIAESRRLGRVGLEYSGLGLPAPTYWRTRSPFSLRSLLTYLESPQRQRLRRLLPSPTSVRLESRLETEAGRVRLEYSMGIAGPREILERLLIEVAGVNATLAFVLVGIDKTLTSSRASLVTGKGVERFRLSRAKCKALIRREYHESGSIESLAFFNATMAILSECAAHWDVFLASPPEPFNQD
jgi:hypothetical protein